MGFDPLFVVGVLLIAVAAVLVVVLLVFMTRLARLFHQRRAGIDPVPPAPPKKGEAAARKVSSSDRAAFNKLKKDAEEAKLEAERLRIEAREVLAVQSDALARQKAELDERGAQLGNREQELAASRQLADAHEAELVRQQDEVLRRLDEVATREAEVNRRAHELAGAEARAQATLERMAGLTADDARAELLSRVEHEARLSASALARDIEGEARREAERKARAVIVESIQRLASEQTTESVVSTVALPSDEMKGRIIGREGRNIRTFEQVTGVNVMIDDTPESVLLSCFDPVRRETARITMVELVKDGRIHPARIEEVYTRSLEQVEERCQSAGEDALLEMKITDLDPALVPILGSLQYRTSYGQNVLKHLIECGHLAALMASELGLDVDLCRRAAFLHDIGKALTHEVEGSHAIVGADLARRHGEHPDVVHAIEAHHNEVEPHTVEAVLTQACDAISGSRPAARRESLEAYVKRLEALETIASDHPGVEKVFAMQAGRDVRVMVRPDAVSDAEASVLARDIVEQIEAELTYPGTIKVTVVRESRATEVAH